MVTRRRVSGIGGIFFKSPDPTGLADWYRDHLGIPVEDGGFALFSWRERDEPSRPGTTVWSIFNAKSAYFGRAEQQAMINYRVDDLDRVLTELRAEGVSVDDRVEHTPNGRFGWITDPDGNRIELWQPPAGQ